MPKPVIFKMEGNSKGFEKAIGRAVTRSKDLGKELGKAGGGARKFGAALTGIAKTLVSTAGKIATLQTNMLGLQGVFRAMGAAKGAVVSFASFEEGMLKLEAVSGFTSDEMKTMQSLIEKLAIETKYTSTEVLKAAFALATLGVKGTDAFEDMLPIVAKTAIAMDRDVGQTAMTVLSTMKQFKIEMKDSSKVADVLVNAYTKSSLNLEKFAYGMQYAGPTAKLFNQSLEDTTALLALLSDRGIDASMAGTQLRAAMSNLITPSSINNKILDKYKLTLEDVNPETQRFADVLNTLAMSGMSSGDMFKLLGKRAAPIVKMLIDMGDETQSGAAKIKSMSGEMGELGTATEVAEKMQSGLGFSFKQTAAGMDLFLIAIGETIDKTLNLKEYANLLTESLVWLTDALRNVDFNILKQEGIKIFEPSSLADNFRVAFAMVLPAAIGVFRTATGIAGLFMLEKIALGFPKVIEVGIPILMSGFLEVVGGGAKLFVSLIVEGFNLVMATLGVYWNQLLGELLDVIGDLASTMGMKDTATEFWQAGAFRKSITAGDLTGFINTDAIKDSANALIDAGVKLSMTGITILSKASAEMMEPIHARMAEFLKAQREGLVLQLPADMQRLGEAVSQVPTKEQYYAVRSIIREFEMETTGGPYKAGGMPLSIGNFMRDVGQKISPGVATAKETAVAEQTKLARESLYAQKELVSEAYYRLELAKESLMHQRAGEKDAKLIERAEQRQQTALDAFNAAKKKLRYYQRLVDEEVNPSPIPLSPAEIEAQKRHEYYESLIEGTATQSPAPLSSAETQEGSMMREKKEAVQINDNRIQHLYRQGSRLQQFSSDLYNRNPKGDKVT